MAYILACLMAGLSFIGNRLLIKYLGPKAILSLGPALEEAAKTLPAYYLQANLLSTHIVFGVIEAIYDMKTGRRHKWGAAAASIVGHMLFGAVTAGILMLSGSLWLSLLSACAIHMGWNVAAVLINIRGRNVS